MHTNGNMYYVHDCFLALGTRRSGTFQECRGIGLVFLAGDGTRVLGLSGGANPQEGWSKSSETWQSLERKNIDMREGKKGIYLKERSKPELASWGTGPTKKTSGGTKTYMNVQVWKKKSSQTILDVSFPAWRGWQALCSLVASWVLPCKGPCPASVLVSMQTR